MQYGTILNHPVLRKTRCTFVRKTHPKYSVVTTKPDSVPFVDTSSAIPCDLTERGDIEF